MLDLVEDGVCTEPCHRGIQEFNSTWTLSLVEWWSCVESQWSSGNGGCRGDADIISQTTLTRSGPWVKDHESRLYPCMNHNSRFHSGPVQPEINIFYTVIKVSDWRFALLSHCLLLLAPISASPIRTFTSNNFEIYLEIISAEPENSHGPKRPGRPLGSKNNGIKSKHATLGIAQRSFIVTKTCTASMQLRCKGVLSPSG